MPQRSRWINANRTDIHPRFKQKRRQYLYINDVGTTVEPEGLNDGINSLRYITWQHHPQDLAKYYRSKCISKRKRNNLRALRLNRHWWGCGGWMGAPQCFGLMMRRNHLNSTWLLLKSIPYKRFRQGTWIHSKSFSSLLLVLLPCSCFTRYNGIILNRLWKHNLVCIPNHPIQK